LHNDLGKGFRVHLGQCGTELSWQEVGIRVSTRDGGRRGGRWKTWRARRRFVRVGLREESRQAGLNRRGGPAFLFLWFLLFEGSVRGHIIGCGKGSREAGRRRSLRGGTLF